MTIDERLDRLTERHEALTLHVELLTADLAQTRTNVNRVVAGIEKLAQIALFHEHRLEGRG